MGKFSWKTQDTDKSISSIKPFTVTMKDNKGNAWTEPNYQGYGVFGGKDFYELLAEMNGKESDRSVGIDIFFGDEPYISPNLNKSSKILWKNSQPEECPNQGMM